ncbi:uncharacterized protein LOC111642462 isoform X2 [Centruroides sculpturatus]|uniref:uncharacterized protein LOC111642462 isoform X2 n=1 Tax=Centruroides sculpturatus TaxID=218467 RepID=UPI000C6E58EF|nr:uncharacterized protein LOC111642462 isoform X2 [Centruroides sculpturatus]
MFTCLIFMLGICLKHCLCYQGRMEESIPTDDYVFEENVLEKMNDLANILSNEIEKVKNFTHFYYGMEHYTFDSELLTKMKHLVNILNTGIEKVEAIRNSMVRRKRSDNENSKNPLYVKIYNEFRSIRDILLDAHTLAKWLKTHYGEKYYSSRL